MVLFNKFFAMQQSNSVRPFSDVSAQKSQLLLSITSSLKGPLLRIYDIGVAKNCSHFKHVVRLCEYILLNPPGNEFSFEFDRQKTEKAQETFSSCGLTATEKIEVFHLWVSMIELIRGYEGEEVKIKEQYSVDFLYWILMKFAGGKNIRTFHIQKIDLFESFKTYSVFVNDLKNSKLTQELTTKIELRPMALMPVC